MGLMEGVIQGALAVLAILSCVIALGAFRIARRAETTAASYPKENEDVIRVVNQVKDQAEEMWDKVESHLGRISRARRGIAQKPQIDLEMLKQAGLQSQTDDQPDHREHEAPVTSRQQLLARANTRRE